VRVTVEDGRIVDVTPLALCGACWAHLTADMAGAAGEAEMIARIAAELASAHALSEGRRWRFASSSSAPRRCTTISSRRRPDDFGTAAQGRAALCPRTLKSC
jgi:hypothetical protein